MPEPEKTTVRMRRNTRAEHVLQAAVTLVLRVHLNQLTTI